MAKNSILRSRRKLLINFFNSEISRHSKIIKENPFVAEVYLYRGFAYEKRGDLKQAIADYSKAIKLKPDYIESYLYRTVAYFCNGDFSKSRKDIHRIEKLGIKLSPVFLRCLKTASGRER